MMSKTIEEIKDSLINEMTSEDKDIIKYNGPITLVSEDGTTIELGID